MPRLTTRYDWPKMLTELRTRQLVTLATLAKELGCTPGAVAKWERGETVPQVRNLKKLREYAEAVGFPVKEWPVGKVAR